MPEHRGFYSRGYHPHYDQPGLLQAITFHLADSLPLRLLKAPALPDELREAHRAEVQRHLDEGWGGCLLSDPEAAQVTEDALLHGDGVRYRLLAWVIMPNHVHVLVEEREGWPLARLVQTWKGYTGRRINALTGRRGAVWQPDYYDRFIRDTDHLRNAVQYVHYNPVRAGLVQEPADWRFGSARRVEAPDRMVHAPYAPWDAAA
jgi:REP element-mobilizing transposase RayT